MVQQDRDVMPFMPIVAHSSDNNTPAKAEASSRNLTQEIEGCILAQSSPLRSRHRVDSGCA